MATSAIAQAQAGTQTVGGQNRAKLGQSFDMFLKMLTTQLQNQDPLSPTDSAEFTNQLVMYSQVEQQISTNDRLEAILQGQNASYVQTALGFIGMDVEVVNRDIELTAKGSSAKFYVDMDEAPEACIVRIKDSSGKIVRSMAGPTEAGKSTITWDGKDNDGNEMAAGTYKVEVTAKDANEEVVPATITRIGHVTGVETVDGEMMLMMGKIPVGIGSVISAKKPEAAV